MSTSLELPVVEARPLLLLFLLKTLARFGIPTHISLMYFCFTFPLKHRASVWKQRELCTTFLPQIGVYLIFNHLCNTESCCGSQCYFRVNEHSFIDCLHFLKMIDFHTVNCSVLMPQINLICQTWRSFRCSGIMVKQIILRCKIGSYKYFFLQGHALIGKYF